MGSCRSSSLRLISMVDNKCLAVEIKPWLAQLIQLGEKTRLLFFTQLTPSTVAIGPSSSHPKPSRVLLA